MPVCTGTNTCKQQGRQIRWICLHPICSNFKELCDECHKNHLQFHQKYKVENEPEPNNTIVTFEDQKNTVEKILLRVREDLKFFKERASSEIQNMENTELPINNIVKELKDIRDMINKEFDHFIEQLIDDYEKPIKDKIKDVYNEIQTKITETDDFIQKLNSTDQLETIKLTSIIDIPYQTSFQKARLEQLFDERTTKKFEGVIDDDVVLRFLGSFQQELKNLIYIPSEKNELKKKLMIQKKRGVPQNSRKNWLFYFEPNTKNFYYVDTSRANAQFTKVVLDISFNFSYGNRSILASDDNIYLIGGYDQKNINYENEEHYKSVYLIDLEQKSLKKVSSLLTLRHSFGLCCFQNYLYVIGGYNYQEGSLAKCEKISLQKDNQHNAIPINNLHQKASHASVCSWQDKLIVKFGGILFDSNSTDQRNQSKTPRILADSLFEFYFPDLDQWIQLPQMNQCMSQSFLSNILEVNDQIYIFGGLDENLQLLKKCTKIQQYNLMKLDIEVINQPDLANKSYSICQPIFRELDNQAFKIFYLSYETNEYKNQHVQPVLRSLLV
ncbi:hypothetical protein ABPG74_013853 [Tetrahymena malaccensis]